jgi:hypothetical protein
MVPCMSNLQHLALGYSRRVPRTCKGPLQSRLLLLGVMCQAWRVSGRVPRTCKGPWQYRLLLLGVMCEALHSRGSQNSAGFAEGEELLLPGKGHVGVLRAHRVREEPDRENIDPSNGSQRGCYLERFPMFAQVGKNECWKTHLCSRISRTRK